MSGKRFTGRATELGTSLVEVIVALGLVAAIVPVFGPLLVTSTRSVRTLQAQSDAVDELRVAVSSIGRELRSAVCIYEPAPNAPARPVLRFLTEANNASYEVTYRTTSDELHRQVSGFDATVTAENLVDPSDAFEHISTPRRSVRLVFRVQAVPDTPVRDITTTIAGRNAWRNC